MARARRADAAGPIGPVGVVAAGLALTFLFIAIGFPYDLLGQRFVTVLARSTGTQVAFGELGPFLSIAGPGFEARNVRVTTAAGTRVALESARVRPAWSASWLRLAPALHLDLVGPGRLVGVATLGASPGFEGELEQVELAKLPIAAVWPGVVLSGRLDASLALRSGEAGPSGSVSLVAHKGNLQAPDALPIVIPYESLNGSLRFESAGGLAVEALELESPLGKAHASGSIGPAASFADAPLDLQVQLKDASYLKPALEGAGVRLSADGSGRFHIGGTPSYPQLR